MYGQDFAALQGQVAEKQLAAQRLAEEEARETARRMALVEAAEAAAAQAALARQQAALATLQAQQEQVRNAKLRTTADLTDKSGTPRATPWLWDLQLYHAACGPPPRAVYKPFGPSPGTEAHARLGPSSAQVGRGVRPCLASQARTHAPLPSPPPAQVFSGEDPLARERARLQAAQISAWAGASAAAKAQRAEEEAARERCAQAGGRVCVLVPC